MKKTKRVKKLFPKVSAGNWSYIVNENGNAIRLTFEGYGSCTPIDIMQGFINRLSSKEFDEIWQECEKRKDIQN
jgi:hypothetical protein